MSKKNYIWTITYGMLLAIGALCIGITATNGLITNPFHTLVTLGMWVYISVNIANRIEGYVDE